MNNIWKPGATRLECATITPQPAHGAFDRVLRPLAVGACLLMGCAGDPGPAPIVTAAGSPICSVVGPSVPSCGRWWGEALDTGKGSLVSAVDRAQASLGRRLDIVHTYHRWDDLFPTAGERALAQDGHLLLIGWKPITRAGRPVSWASIAAGRQDNIVRTVARRLRALDVPVLLSFSYEPERLIGTNGTPAQFAAAFRHIHDVMARAGATNVRWVWTVIGLTSPHWQRTYLQLWPGQKYVDWIGWDPYNWASCRKTSWSSFRQMVQPFYRWITNQDLGNKPLMLAEYGTVESTDDPGRKGLWFSAEAQALESFPRLLALVYFNLPSPPASCDWQSTTSPTSESDFGSLARSAPFEPTQSLNPVAVPGT